MLKKFSLENKPKNIKIYKKTGLTYLSFVSEPFIVETQEGDMTISPDTVDDWDGGYFIAVPADGSKMYSIAPSFVKKNYKECTNLKTIIEKIFSNIKKFF